MKKLLIAPAVTALMALPGISLGHGICSDSQQDHCQYWHDSSGVYAKDSYGQCIKTGRWKPGSMVEGCDAMPMKPMAPMDSDGDGVYDDTDQCPGTPAGTPVDAQGCALPMDSDGDGVTDDKDRCPNTPRGAKVDMRGCELDSDGDGVVNSQDRCPNTRQGVKVDAKGCEIPQMKSVSVKLDVKFALNSTRVESAYATQMEALAYVLKANPNDRVTIHGHTDSAGGADYNLALSQRRAEAVAKYLVDNYGVNPAQLSAVGHGETLPIADNATREGRSQNRRVVAEYMGMVKK